jgi:hypothetical protein
MTLREVYKSGTSGQPTDGMVDALTALYKRGWKIHVVTARSGWHKSKIESWCGTQGLSVGSEGVIKRVWCTGGASTVQKGKTAEKSDESGEVKMSIEDMDAAYWKKWKKTMSKQTVVQSKIEVSVSRPVRVGRGLTG